MIVSDAHRFVFVHVPKCAGTSVRLALQPFHDRPVRMELVQTHPRLGPLDYGHLTLATLADGFPELLERVKDYESHALIRDPVARFPSSLAQRLRMHKRRVIAELTKPELDREVDEVLDHLSGGASVTDPTFIHFERQIAYVDLGGDRLVRHLHPVERVDEFLAAAGRRLGADLAPALQDRRNRTIYADETTARKLDDAELNPGLRRAARRVLPAGLRRLLRNLLFPPFETAKAILDRRDVQRFIETHYAEDARLHAELVARASEPTHPERIPT